MRRPAALVLSLLLVVPAGCRTTSDPVAGTDVVAESDVPAGPEVTPDDAVPPAAAPAPTVDPCTLVPKAAAERLAGTPLEEPVAAPGSCTYTGPVSGPTAQVEVYVGAGAKKILDIDRELGHDLKPVPGVGDEAHLEDGAVFVNAGDVWVAIRLVSLADPAASRQALQDLARDVVTRL